MRADSNQSRTFVQGQFLSEGKRPPLPEFRNSLSSLNVLPTQLATRECRVPDTSRPEPDFRDTVGSRKIRVVGTSPEQLPSLLELYRGACDDSRSRQRT